MTKVSIIVPVYNVEAYLERCVDSILCQSLQEIEVLLVDDGSTDACGEICDQYAGQDHRVKVIHKANGGLSDARNAGIKQATGAFIGFVDGDDYIEPEMYEVLYQACLENDAPIGACDYIYQGEETGEVFSCSTGECGKLSAEDFFRKVLQSPSAVGMGVWDKIYQRELFQRAQFRKGRLHEDTDILYRLVFQAEFVSYISRPYYVHCEREGSITGSSYGVRDYDRFNANGRMFRYIEACHPKLLRAAADNRCRSMVKIVNNMADSRVYDGEMYGKIRQEILELLPVLCEEDGFSVSLHWQLRLISIGYFPYGFIRGIYRFVKKMRCFKNHESK